MPLLNQLSLKHLLCALSIIIIWGINFVAIKIGTLGLPPLTMAALRLILTVLPAIFFVRCPPIPLARLATYGICLYGGQFGFLFAAIHLGATAGLASVTLQIQVFLTMMLATVWLHDRPSWFQWLGAVIAFAGMGIIALHIGGDMTAISLLLLLCAASSWALGNVLTRQFGRINPLALVVWGNVFAAPIMVGAALTLEGWPYIAQTLAHTPMSSWLALAYITYLSGLLGYAVWSWFLARYQSAAIVPLTLLVPVTGLGASALILGESLYPWKLLAAGVVMAGVLMNAFGARLWAVLFGLSSRLKA